MLVVAFTLFLIAGATASNELGDDIQDLVTFGLYTRLNNDTYQQLYVGDADTLVNSNFDFTLDTKIIIHGWLDHMSSDSIQKNKNAFLDNYDVNVIGVDWGLIARDPIYTLAANQTKRVGKFVAQFIDFLASASVGTKTIHLIGHSLGAHVSGFAGEFTTAGKISRISGLDAALPFFFVDEPDERLDPTDADFVDCIHTCGGLYGFKVPICHVDFYPNGGVPNQPGCPVDLGTCSHLRSILFYSESINPEHAFPTSSCTDVPDRSGDGCTLSDVRMGYPAPTSSSGIYYAKTNSTYPYAPIHSTALS